MDLDSNLRKGNSNCPSLANWLWKWYSFPWDSKLNQEFRSIDTRKLKLFAWKFPLRIIFGARLLCVVWAQLSIGNWLLLSSWLPWSRHQIGYFPPIVEMAEHTPCCDPWFGVCLFGGHPKPFDRFATRKIIIRGHNTKRRWQWGRSYFGAHTCKMKRKCARLCDGTEWERERRSVKRFEYIMRMGDIQEVQYHTWCLRYTKRTHTHARSRSLVHLLARLSTRKPLLCIYIVYIWVAWRRRRWKKRKREMQCSNVRVWCVCNTNFHKQYCAYVLIESARSLLLLLLLLLLF